MKGYTIQHSIELLEKEVQAGSGSGGASTAAEVSFDNTGTGLVATNVQAALSELDAREFKIGTTETVVGTYNGKPLYQKLVELTTSTSAVGSLFGGDSSVIGIANVEDLFVDLTYGSARANNIYFAKYNSTDDILTVYSLYALSSTTVTYCVRYTKTESTRKSTKKK